MRRRGDSATGVDDGRGMIESDDITLRTPLSLRASLRFPVQHATARREVAIGAVLLFIPVVGWLLNMGHRIMMVHRMQHGHAAWPSWSTPHVLLRHGVITFLGMVMYYLPAALFGTLSVMTDSAWWLVPAALGFVGATIAIPGYMSHYCVAFDPREIFDPACALRRCVQAGPAYWHAWGIALAALVLSFLGLLVFGVGFLFTSVWFLAGGRLQLRDGHVAHVCARRSIARPRVSRDRDLHRGALTP